MRKAAALGAVAVALAACGYEEDEPGAASPRMRGNVEPLAAGYRVVVDELIDDSTAVVAAVGADGRPPGAFATVLTRQGDTWFIEPQGLDLAFGVSATYGTALAAKPRIDFDVNVAGQPSWKPEARLWLESGEPTLRRHKLSHDVHFVAQVSPLKEGRHWVVAFARVAERTHAIAWTFTAE